MILLTDEDMDAVYASQHDEGNCDNAIAKAQLKKVAVWRLEPCPHFNDDTIRGGCGQCWQALLEEVKE